jgi:hypothetical protein
MFFRQLLNDSSACASYLFGCKTKARFAVVDPGLETVAVARGPVAGAALLVDYILTVAVSVSAGTAATHASTSDGSCSGSAAVTSPLATAASNAAEAEQCAWRELDGDDDLGRLLSAHEPARPRVPRARRRARRGRSRARSSS